MPSAGPVSSRWTQQGPPSSYLAPCNLCPQQLEGPFSRHTRAVPCARSPQDALPPSRQNLPCRLLSKALHCSQVSASCADLTTSPLHSSTHARCIHTCAHMHTHAHYIHTCAHKSTCIHNTRTHVHTCSCIHPQTTMYTRATQTHLHPHALIHPCANIFVHAQQSHPCIHAHAQSHMHTVAHICTVYSQVHTCVHIHRHAHRHMYIHKYMHVLAGAHVHIQAHMHRVIPAHTCTQPPFHMVNTLLSPCSPPLPGRFLLKHSARVEVNPLLPPLHRAAHAGVWMGAEPHLVTTRRTA